MKEPDQSAATPTKGEGRLVAKNMAYLAGAQVITIPLAVVTNALFARFLGPADFGLIYLAATMCAFGILIIEWGQQGSLPALIAKDRPRAAEFLGTGFAWRGMTACAVYLFLAGLSLVLGYSGLFQWVLALTFLTALLNSLAGGYKDSIRGFERTDIPAIAHVAQQVLLFAVVMAVLAMGGRLNGLLIAGAAVALVAVLGLSRASRRVGIGTLQVRREYMTILLVTGTPFVFNDLAIALRPIVDALFLSSVAPEEVIGWYAVTRRLVGVLILPATTLMGSLYPTLCRLWGESRDGFATTTAGALNGVALLAVPAALGCALYPQIGIAVFGEEGFGPAEDNLRVMSLFLFLIYFSMPIGSAVLAAGKRRAWSVLQCLCLAVGVALNPFLVPWFQTHMGNGGLGLCVAAVVTEVLVVGGSIALLPRGVLNRSVMRTLTLALLSGLPMVAVAFVLDGRLSMFLAAPLAVLTYCLAALATGAVTKVQRDAVFGALRRRVLRWT